MTGHQPGEAEVSLYVIAAHWLDDPDWPDYRGNEIGLGEPFCARCGWLAPVMDGRGSVSWRAANKFIDRAHLVDRWLGGPGISANLVPLCHQCHRLMPSFGKEDLADALDWVRSGPRCHWAFQMVTDTLRAGTRKTETIVCFNLFAERMRTSETKHDFITEAQCLLDLLSERGHHERKVRP